MWVRTSALALTAITLAAGCKTPPPPPNPEVFFEPRIVDVEDHRLQVGDTLEFIYTIGPVPITAEGGYRINVNDRLRVDFAYNDEFDAEMIVRPDGKVTLPIIGEQMAYGLTPTELAENLTEIYDPYLLDPIITVDVPQFTSLTEQISRAIVTPQGTTRTFVYPVRPDGHVTLVGIGDVQAFGRTVTELDQSIRDQYAEIGHPEIEVTPVLVETGAQQVYVLGEVAQEGIIPMDGDITALQAITAAGGNTDRGNLRSVMLLRRMPDGSTQGHRLNLAQAIRTNDFTQNVYLRPYDIVYVPREFISDVNVLIDQYVTRGIYALLDRPIDLFIGLEVARENQN